MVEAHRAAEDLDRELARRTVEREPGEGVVLVDRRVQSAQTRRGSRVTGLDIEERVRAIDGAAPLDELGRDRLQLAEPSLAHETGQVQVPIALVLGASVGDHRGVRHRPIVFSTACDARHRRCYGSSMADATRLAEAVAELVRIPSVNPLQCDDPAITGAGRLAEHLAGRAHDLGAEVELDPVFDGRPNLIARFAGDRPEVVLIDVHLDTVAVEHMTVDPFDGRIADDRVYGRGAVDTKATFALVLETIAGLRAEGRRPGPTVLLVGTVSEEIGGLPGARRLAEMIVERGQRLDRVIVAEPTVCAPVHGHRGGVGLEVCLHGHAAHSSKPALGMNAVSAAARVIAAVYREQERLATNPEGLALGGGSLSVTEIRGGVARNIIPDRCELYAGRRLAPGEDPAVEFARLVEMITAAATQCRAEVTMSGGRGFPAFLTDPDDPFVTEIARLSGERPETASYGSNCAAYDALTVPKVLFGPGSIDQAHQAVEWVDIEQLVRAADVYQRLLAPA